jgi:hypothetical protein
MYLITDQNLTSKAKKLSVKKIVLNASTQQPVILNMQQSKNKVLKNDYIMLESTPKHYNISFKGFEMMLSSNGIYTILKDIKTGLTYQAY